MVFRRRFQVAVLPLSCLVYQLTDQQAWDKDASLWSDTQCPSRRNLFTGLLECMLKMSLEDLRRIAGWLIETASGFSANYDPDSKMVCRTVTVVNPQAGAS